MLKNYLLFLQKRENDLTVATKLIVVMFKKNVRKYKPQKVKVDVFKLILGLPTKTHVLGLVLNNVLDSINNKGLKKIR